MQTLTHTIAPIQDSFNELPHLGFSRYLPHPQLRDWVEHYWVAQQNHLVADEISETLYPDGGTSLSFVFESVQLPELVLKAGQRLNKVYFHKKINRLGIRFKPGGIFAIFGVDAEITQTNGDIFELAELSDDDILYQLAEAESTQQRLKLIDDWLVMQIDALSFSNNLLQKFVPIYLTADEPFDDLIARESLSRRQIERKFQREIGLSPAQLKQLNRVKLARQLITKTPDISLTQVAVNCGYYDQAHFIKHFQKITGQTPGQYKERKMSQKYNAPTQ